MTTGFFQENPNDHLSSSSPTKVGEVYSAFLLLPFVEAPSSQHLAVENLSWVENAVRVECMSNGPHDVDF